MASLQPFSSTGIVSQSAVLTFDRAGLSRWLPLAAGRRVQVEVRPIEQKGPSRRQRGYYFPVVCAAMGEAGYTKDEAHETLKRALLGVQNPDIGLSPLISITTLTPEQFVRYVEDCVMLLARELGIIVPPPDPAWRAGGFLAEMGRS